jgi:hypothetical protein
MAFHVSSSDPLPFRAAGNQAIKELAGQCQHHLPTGTRAWPANFLEHMRHGVLMWTLPPNSLDLEVSPRPGLPERRQQMGQAPNWGGSIVGDGWVRWVSGTGGWQAANKNCRCPTDASAMSQVSQMV